MKTELSTQGTDRVGNQRGRAVTRVLTALVLAVALAAAAGTSTTGQAQTAATASLPAKLSDAEFWALATEISEPGGYFRIADNFTSNEMEVGPVFASLRERKLSGGVYLGVGPEQNFSYISAIKPAMAFILDIRRQAVMQHLMFKAMFELSKDRADFLSLLFAKARPKDLDATMPVQKLWETYFPISVDATLVTKTRDRVVEHLVKTHKFTLNADELAQLDWVMSAFAQYGPGITTNGSNSSGRGGGANNRITFADLTGWSLDASGVPQSFLATDESFQIVKALHDKNLIVPVSGDFGGAKALRGIGAYLTARNARVSAFYLSNVEQYLYQDSKATAFYDNVATLPITETSVFIRPYALRSGGNALCGIASFLKSVQAGRVYDNRTATACMN